MINGTLFVVDYIVSPAKFVKELKNSRSWLFSFLVFAAAVFTQSVAGQVMSLHSGRNSAGMLVLDFCANMAAGSIGLVIFAAWVHFAADLMNKITSVSTIMKVCFVSAAPLLFCVPISLLIASLAKNPMVYYYLLYLLILLKILQLLFVGIRDSCYMDSGETLMIFAAPVIIIPAVCACFFVMFLIYIVALFV